MPTQAVDDSLIDALANIPVIGPEINIRISAKDPMSYIAKHKMTDEKLSQQFIDPKMPGFVPNSEELGLCKNLVGRLRSAVDAQRGKVEPPLNQKRKAEAR